MALTQEPANLITDPLALRFMTGEQMGYMPAAQYLTPSEYGAFRTLPAPQGHNYLYQDPGFLQSLMIRSRGSLGFLPTYTFNTYNPAVNQQQYMYRMRTRSDDSLMAMGGVGADIAASLGVGMMLGGVPGLVAGMLMPDISKPMMDRIRDMRGIQNITMSKIVAGNDVNQVTGAGFNAASARTLDSFLRTQSAGDVLMKQGDWRKLLQMGIEHGQFDYAGNVEQYKDALKKLRKSITTVMEVAGSTDFKDVMKEYKRMRTMGADLSEYTNIIRKEDMYSRVTGMSHADMVNTYGQQGALIYQQAGLTGYQGSLQAMHNAASITLMQRTGLLGPGALSRYGGISGMAQAMTQQDATAQNRIADFMLPYFMKEDGSGLDDSASLRDILNSNDPLGMLGRAAGRKTRTLEQRMRFDHNRGDLMQKLQERYGQENITAVLALQTGHQVRLKGIEALEYGYRQLGYDPNIAHLKAKNFASSDFREQEERELQLARRKLREERDLAENPFRKFARTLDKTFTRWGENIFGGMTSAYAGWSERNAANAEGNYRVGGGMPNSSDWQNQVNIDTSFPSAQSAPVPHPVTNLEELAAPAEKTFSGGDSGKIAWNKKDGARYGLFGWSAEQMNEFGKWVKQLGPKGAYWADEFEKAGGFKNFASLDEAQKSEIGQVLSELSKDDDFAKKQREYVYEKFYKPSIDAFDPKTRAEFMASESAQKAFFLDVTQIGAPVRKEVEDVIPASEPIKVPDAHRKKSPRSTRNLSVWNFGNVQHSDMSGKDAAYASKQDGLLSIGERILRYHTSKKFGYAKSVLDVMNHFAPPHENNTIQYAKTIAAKLGVSHTAPVNFYDPKVMGTMIRAITNYEHFNLDDQISEEDYKIAANAAISGAKPVEIGYAEDRSGLPTQQSRKVKRTKVTSAAADIISEAIRVGGGRFSTEGISIVLKKYRNQYKDDPDQLAILDQVEKELNGNLNADNKRRVNEDDQRRVVEEMRKKLDAEIATVDDKIFGPLRHDLKRSREGKNGRAEGQIEVPQITQNLNRYESGIDMVGGTVNWDSVADTLSGAIGKNAKGEPKFKASDLGNAIQGKGTARILRGVVNEQTSIEFAKSILENKTLGLSKDDVKIASQNPVIRAMFYATAMRSISQGDASEIFAEHTSRAVKWATGERRNQLAVAQRFYKKYTDDSFEMNLPGVSKLGKEYEIARKELFKSAYEGDDSTPYSLKVARLFLLKSLATKPGIGDSYKKEFIIEAKKLGFDKKWIALRLAEGRGMIADDVKSNPLLANLKAEDIDNIQKVTQGLLAEDSNYAEGRLQDLTTKYNQNLVHPDAILLKSEAVLAKVFNNEAIELYAQRVGIDRDRLLTPEGMKELQRRVVDGRIASKWDLQIAKKALRQYHKTGVISPSVFLMSGARRGMEDGTTHTALNSPLKGEEIWEQVRREEQQRAQTLPETQQQKKQEDVPQNGAGSPLKDETVQKLNKAIEALIEFLKGQETKKR